jgi:hypothetical protein
MSCCEHKDEFILSCDVIMDNIFDQYILLKSEINKLSDYSDNLFSMMVSLKSRFDNY